jgi:hypothetical protein
MASVSRYRGGNVSFRAYPTANDAAVAHAIEVGDLVYVASNVAYAASHLVDAGSADDNRASLAAKFVGVAVQKIGLQTGETSARYTTDPGWILVAESGDFELDCASTSWNQNDLVGVYTDGTSCSDQNVAKVTAYDQVIGTARVPYNSLGDATTTVIVSLRPKLAFNQVVSGSGS